MGPQHHLTLKISWKRNLYILKFVCNQEKMIRIIAPILIIKWYMVTEVKGGLISEGLRSFCQQKVPNHQINLNLPLITQ